MASHLLVETFSLPSTSMCCYPSINILEIKIWVHFQKGDLETGWPFPIFDKPIHQDRWEDVSLVLNLHKTQNQHPLLLMSVCSMNKIEPSGQTNKNTKQSLGMCKICRMPSIKIGGYSNRSCSDFLFRRHAFNLFWLEGCLFEPLA